MPEFAQLPAKAAIRRLRLVLVSPLVCIAIGCFAGGSYLTLAGLRGGEPIAQMALSFPMAMLVSVVIAGPLGLVCGVLGAGLALGLERTYLRHAPRSRWLKTGASAGGIAGLFVALIYLVLGTDGAFALVVLAACGLSGTAVGWLGWREFGTQSAS